jgi:hypothetical protein
MHCARRSYLDVGAPELRRRDVDEHVMHPHEAVRAARRGRARDDPSG